METKFTKLFNDADSDSEIAYWAEVFYFGFKKLFQQKLIDNKYPCDVCGQPIKFTGMVFESYPPQFQYSCCNCGKMRILDCCKHEILEEFRLLDSVEQKTPEESEEDKKGE